MSLKLPRLEPHRSLRATLACLLALTLAGTLAWAVGPVERGPVAPQVPAVKVEQGPRIDGHLDDACWQSATHLVGFWRLENAEKEYEPTEAWICQDKDTLYLAWYCHDSKPETITAQQKKRGGSLLADDWVGVDLDVDFGHQRTYWFDVSAGGVQVESIPGGAAAKIEWRGDWQAATSRVADGWQAEMALPLSIFRYPKGQSTFGIVLIRRLARQDDWSVWPAIGPGFELMREAAWSGLALPTPKQGPVVMPYVLAEAGGDNQGVTAGLDVKHRFSNGLQGMLAYNPDFRDIEDVVENIDFTYVERYLSEYRPFFLEGGGFHPSSRLFYSRRIADFDAGVKVFGQDGPNALGALYTAQFGEAQNLALNERYYLTPLRSLTTSLVAHRATGEPDNLAYQLSTDQRFQRADGDLSYWGTWQGSSTQGEGGDGSYLGAGLTRSRQAGLSWEAGWQRLSSGFDPVLGYVPETGVHSTWLNATHRTAYPTGALMSRSWWVSTNEGGSENGRRWTTLLGGSASRRDQRSLYVEAGLGGWDGFGERTISLGSDWANRDMYRSGSLSLAVGERLRHAYRYLSVEQGVGLGDRLALRLRAEYAAASELDDDRQPTPVDSHTQYVATVTYDLNLERALSARLVTRDGETNAYLAFRQKTRKGVDAWIILGDPNASELTSRLAVKAVWVF